jgi:hypothetical protein
VDTGFRKAAFKSLLDSAAPTGYTAGTQANLYLTPCIRINYTITERLTTPALLMKKIYKNIGNTFRFNMPISHIVDLYDWSDGTAA